ncbi:Uncharacterized protein TCAP_01045 [Tolypocladium capitatum]|uniref:37S ribosomal protein mrp21, mitochondrial n=1 Tax=Tolypocladium capitatum TaxID=45235 RepID=A0A2K3QNB9_9HYPO|nr:Uncharacterized protein TCAP_01045 [Tolypocladium capitatum]
MPSSSSRPAQAAARESQLAARHSAHCLAQKPRPTARSRREQRRGRLRGRVGERSNEWTDGVCEEGVRIFAGAAGACFLVSCQLLQASTLGRVFRYNPTANRFELPPATCGVGPLTVHCANWLVADALARPGSRAATLRFGSSMLSRVVASSIRAPSVPARALSTSLPVRFGASSPSHDASSSRPPRARSNPLVGNLPPAQSQQPAEEDGDGPVSTAPSRSSRPPMSGAMPPPPPPPPAATSTPSASETLEAKPDHPYTAADASTPLNLDIASIIANKSAAYGRALGVGDPLTRPKVRAKAVAGRTVFVKDRLTPTSAPTPMVALRVLDRLCRDQKIRNKYHSQKFHERKGLRKKRLRSQRWRARFKTGFKAAVSRVLELKKQGW